jgi:hypothetical protein
MCITTNVAEHRMCNATFLVCVSLRKLAIIYRVKLGGLPMYSRLSSRGACVQHSSLPGVRTPPSAKFSRFFFLRHFYLDHDTMANSFDRSTYENLGLTPVTET